MSRFRGAGSMNWEAGLTRSAMKFSNQAASRPSIHHVPPHGAPSGVTVNAKPTGDGGVIHLRSQAPREAVQGTLHRNNS